jgi:hypothetical protein
MRREGKGRVYVWNGRSREGDRMKWECESSAGEVDSRCEKERQEQ